MSWHNLSEKEFDAKMKSYVEGKKTPFDAQAWDKMSLKLDQVFPSNNGTSAGNNWGLITVIAILAGLFFWNISFQANSNTEPNKPQVLSSALNTPSALNQSASKNEEDFETEQKGLIGSSQNLQSKPAHTSETPSRENSNAIQESDYKSGLTKNKKTINEPAANELLEVSSASDNQQQVETTLDEQQNDPDSHVKEANVNARIAPKTVKASNKKEPVAITHLQDQKEYERPVKNTSDKGHDGGSANRSTIRSGELFAIFSHGPDINWMELNKLELPKSQKVIVNETPVVISRSSRWSFGLGYAPDISLVGFSEVTNPGTNLAISIDYKVGSRWSIQTGATFAKKKYIANGDDYDPPAGFWSYGTIPDRTDATCNVIDIPLNVRYYFKERKNHRMFASTGLSTYFMLRENYDYDYERNYPGLLQNWNVRNENQHIFGIYNFSIGYQRALSSNWSLEIEPFIKAPLSGIGFGRVNLWSTGTMFSVQFRLP